MRERGTRDLSTVMPGLGPGIHELTAEGSRVDPAETRTPLRDLTAHRKLVDARPKAWHDDRSADEARPQGSLIEQGVHQVLGLGDHRLARVGVGHAGML